VLLALVVVAILVRARYVHGRGGRRRSSPPSLPHPRNGARRPRAAYVEAARALGCPPSRVTLQHILPNIRRARDRARHIAIAWSIIIGASLSFLGLGRRRPSRVGARSQHGRNYLLRAGGSPAGPGIAIMTTVIAVNLVGDTLRDVLDPRLRSLTNL